MRNRVIAPVGLVLLFMLSGCAAAGGRVPRASPDERYKFVSENMNKFVTGGRVTQIKWAGDGSSVEFTRGEQRMRFDLQAHVLTEIAKPEQPSAGERRGARPPRSGPARGRQRERVTSPDEKWVAVCREWNVVIERAKPPTTDPRPAAEESNDETAGEIIHVTTDGHRKFRYGTASWVYGEELDQRDAMWWSPDSNKLVFYEFDEREVPDHYITADLTERHSKLLTEGYPKPGEPNPIANLLICDLAANAITRVQMPPVPEDDPEWYTYGVQFAPGKEKAELLFFRTNRHQSVLHLVAADIESGECRIVLTEPQETWQDNSPPFQFLKDGRRFIWTTEKTGWKQLELRDLDGSLITTLTRGEYPVSSIVKVDEDAGYVFYTAYSDANPLSAQLHRVNLDGTNQIRLTHEPLNHAITMSPDAKWFITEYEAIGIPPAAALYDRDGRRIATLAESDTSVFTKHGLEMPEPFSFKADDGVTDLYGVLYKPSDFKTSRKYPLVVDVYGGPLSQSVRNRFSPARPECEYGVLIAAMDNRGTVNRGKAFESATYLRLGDVDIKDQADGVRFLAQRKYVDGTRVGIMGHSYGGYMSALAVLKHPDVFHVAAAGGTVTDWRQYDTIYTERYMRTPQENPEGYDAGSCMKYVNQFKGKLLLLHGVVDDNVHSNNAWQLIDALQKAGKKFEMMFYPNAGHSLGAGANTARWEFLRRALLN